MSAVSFSYIYNGFSSLFQNSDQHKDQPVSYSARAYKAVENVFDKGAKIAGDPEILQKVVKIAGDFIALQFAPESCCGGERFHRLLKVFNVFDSTVDGTRAPCDLFSLWDKFSQEKHEGRWASLGTRVGFIVVDACCVLSWASEFDLINLSRAAETIGRIKVFGANPLSFVPKMALSTVCVHLATWTLTLATIDEVQKLMRGGDPTNAMLALACCISSLCLNLLMIANYANVVVIGALGILSNTIGIANSLYEPGEGQTKGGSGQQGKCCHHA